jgi:hypothetical protein
MLPGHVFISYVREDSQSVDWLQWTLKQAGLRVWRDTADLWPGEDWRGKIRHAISENALVFLACFSTQGLARQRSYQNEELLLAIEQLRRRRPDDPWLIPVRFDDCKIPDFDLGGGRSLASIQHSDLFGDKATGAARLVVAIQRILARNTNATIAVSDGAEPATVISYDYDNRLHVPTLAGSPLVLSGQRSKVLELDLPLTAYRVIWNAEGKGHFAVRHESGRRGKGALVVNEVAPNPDSGESIVRIDEPGVQVFSIDAPNLAWTLTFAPITLQVAGATASASISKAQQAAQTVLPSLELPTSAVPYLDELRKYIDRSTALSNLYSQLLNEAVPEVRQQKTPRGRKLVYDRLADRVAPVTEQMVLNAANEQRALRAVDEHVRQNLRIIRSASREQQRSVSAYLDSVERMAGANLDGVTAAQRAHDNAEGLKGYSPKFDK